MPYFSQMSLDEPLNRANITIINAMEDEAVQGVLALFGYTADRMQGGRNLLETAQTLHLKQKSEYGDQYAATEALDTAFDTANTSYIRWLKVARVALEGDTNAMVTLGINGRRKKALAGWLAQARQFYSHALADVLVLEKLAVYGLSADILTAGQAEVETVAAALLAQKKEMGEAQQATKNRDEAVDDLEEWLHLFLQIARIALEETPQYLEKLGVVEPS